MWSGKFQVSFSIMSRWTLMHMGVLEEAQDYAGFVLFEIFDRLGGVAALPQATTARMKHYMQDAATGFGVHLP